MKTKIENHTGRRVLDGSEVVRVLAERDGWTEIPCVEGGNILLGEPLPDYLHSTDALRPVLAKLTQEEWRWLVERIALMYEASGEHGLMRYTLTLDPPVLARAVAEAVVACRKEGGG